MIKAKVRKCRSSHSPCLQGAHRYTTGGGMCALRGLLRRALSVLRQPKGETTIPLRRLRLLPFSELCVQTKAKEPPLSAHKVFQCAPIVFRQKGGVAYG